MRAVNFFHLCYNKLKLKEDNYILNSKRPLKTEIKVECEQFWSISGEGDKIGICTTRPWLSKSCQKVKRSIFHKYYWNKKYWDLSFTFSATRNKNLWLAAPRWVPWHLAAAFSAFSSATESLHFIPFCRIISGMEVSNGWDPSLPSLNLVHRHRKEKYISFKVTQSGIILSLTSRLNLVTFFTDFLIQISESGLLCFAKTFSEF